jgi:hypothetical protein
MTLANSSGQYGPSQFTVSSTPGIGSYTTIATAVAAASTAGVGTVYLYPGTYTESISWPSGITVSGLNASTGTGIPGLSFASSIIIGNQTYSGSGNLSFQNIAFESTSGTTWSIALPANATINFSECAINNSGGGAVTVSGSTGALFSADSTEIDGSTTAITASGNFTVALNANILSSGSGNTLTVGANTSVLSQANTYITTSGSNIALTAATSLYESSLSSYFSPSTSANCIQFQANGTAASINEIFNSSATSGFYISSTGSFGQASVGNATLTGTAVAINPLVTTTFYPVNPVASASSLTWTAISASQTIVKSNGYIVTGGTPTLTLPATSAIGDTFTVILDGGTSWTVAQNAGQQLRVGKVLSTSGTGGSLTSSASGDSISFVCTATNTRWAASGGPEGNLIIT